jgi:hypothetical protein
VNRCCERERVDGFGLCFVVAISDTGSRSE